MTNALVRNALKENKLCLWQLADLLEVSEPTIVRKLRHELPEEEQKKMVSLIKEEAKRK